MGYWTLEILLGSEWESCRFDSEIEAQATYVAVSSDYKEEVRGAHLVTPKGVIQHLKHHHICEHQTN
jgi:hypothetical protein